MHKKKIFIAADHAGFELKGKICAFFEAENLPYEDLGTKSAESCDYADFAHLLCARLDENSFGVLVCGTGIGMSVAANRHSGVRCALCSEILSARLARKHNDANVLALGARLLGTSLAIEIVREFINTGFEGGRHRARLTKIEVQR